MGGASKAAGGQTPHRPARVALAPQLPASSTPAPGSPATSDSRSCRLLTTARLIFSRLRDSSLTLAASYSTGGHAGQLTYGGGCPPPAPSCAPQPCSHAPGACACTSPWLHCPPLSAAGLEPTALAPPAAVHSVCIWAAQSVLCMLRRTWFQFISSLKPSSFSLAL